MLIPLSIYNDNEKFGTTNCYSANSFEPVYVFLQDAFRNQK